MQSLPSSNGGEKLRTIVSSMHSFAEALSGAVALTSPASGVMTAMTRSASPDREQAQAA